MRCVIVSRLFRFIESQNFFHGLFSQYPKLYGHPKVVALFEVSYLYLFRVCSYSPDLYLCLQLQRFSPERKGSSIYSTPESYYDVYSAAALAPPLLPSAATPSYQPQLTTRSAEAYQRVMPGGGDKGGGMSIVNFVNATSSAPASRPGAAVSGSASNNNSSKSPAPPPSAAQDWTV